MSALRMLLITLTNWMERQEREALCYLFEENRVLRRQLDGRRVRLTDDDLSTCHSACTRPLGPSQLTWPTERRRPARYRERLTALRLPTSPRA